MQLSSRVMKCSTFSQSSTLRCYQCPSSLQEQQVLGAGCLEQLLELGTSLVLGSHRDNAHTEDADQQGRGVSKCTGITCRVLLSRFVNISHVPAFFPSPWQPAGEFSQYHISSLVFCVCVRLHLFWSHRLLC